MKLLLDTNILLRLAQPSSSDHATVKSAVLNLANAQTEFCVVPQVIYEFWVVATRPQSVNGLGMDVNTAERSVLTITQDFLLLRDERGVFGRWQSLVVANSVSGKTAHDARLVAAMHRHGLTNILTFNVADFVRFPGVRVFSPQEVLSGQLPS